MDLRDFLTLAVQVPDDMKAAIKSYVAANNKVHRTRFQAHFPKPYVFRLSEAAERPRSTRGTAARASGDPEQ